MDDWYGDFQYFLELDKLVYIRYINHDKSHDKSHDNEKAYLVYQSGGKLMYRNLVEGEVMKFDISEFSASDTHAFIWTTSKCLIYIGLKC